MARRKPKKCCHCGKRAVRFRAWCRKCLQRIRESGAVDIADYPTQSDARRLRATAS